MKTFWTLIYLFICYLGSSKGQRAKNKHINSSDCGKRYTQVTDIELGSFTTETGKFPWHVGIYKYDRFLQNYENICGGTIISSHMVVTAASCVYDTVEKAAIKPTFFKVVAGKLAYDWTKPDSNAQEINVDGIEFPETYLGDINSYAENIAILNLAKDLHFNDIVHPICVDWVNRRQDMPNRILETAGWGLKGDVRFTPTLKEAALQFINIVECRKKYSSIRYLRFINYDKICVLTPNGRRDHDTGGGLVYKNNERYYLLGIMSANINNDFSPSTNISKHFPWMEEVINKFKEKKRCSDGFQCLDGNCIEERLMCDQKPDCTDGSDEAFETCPLNGRETQLPKGSCLLPSQRGGVSYIKVNCQKDCELKSGVHIFPSEQVHVVCGKGFSPKNFPAVDKYICNNGTFFPEEPECIKMCSGLTKSNLNFECTYNKQEVPCNTFLNPGTVVKYSCKPHYKAVDPLGFIDYTECEIGGKWKDHIPDCAPECGIKNSVQTTISLADTSSYGKYPWHVGIFKMFYNNNTYVNICGGTIIHPSFILTAAHCLVDLGTNKQFIKSDLRIAAGKFKRDWYTNERYEQPKSVQDLIIPETYIGADTKYEHDIALIKIDSPFVLSSYVMPACIDRSRPIFIPPNQKGTITGWGLTEDEVYSEELKEISLPIMPTVACRNRYKYFRAFITSDKFCVIYKDGAGTQVGDSGGGITFLRDGRYFIHGVVSTKKRDENYFSAFTNVTYHLDWITQSVKFHRRS